MITVTRYHDFCAGHRVVGHENKCAHLHGHNYRVHFTLAAESALYDLAENSGLDSVGRVIDFSVIKNTLCQWLEDNWDHKMLIWQKDKLMCRIETCVNQGDYFEESYELCELFSDSIVWVPFNPTAENMAQYLIDTVASELLKDKGVELIKVVIEETRKCSVTCEKGL